MYVYTVILIIIKWENISYIQFYLLYIEHLGKFLENYLINSAELILCLKRKGNLISA